MTDDALSEKQAFELARELIKDENGLVNHRLTWFLILQGLLFNAFVNGIGLYGKTSRPVYISIGALFIGLLGIVSSFTTFRVVKIAYHQIEQVKKWLAKRETVLPPVAGDLPKLDRRQLSAEFRWCRQNLFSISCLPLVIMLVWSSLIVLLAAGTILN